MVGRAGSKHTHPAAVRNRAFQQTQLTALSGETSAKDHNLVIALVTPADGRGSGVILFPHRNKQ